MSRPDFIYTRFDPEVTMTRHDWAYGTFELVVDIGSSLGLWIGISFLGIFDHVVTMAD